MQEMNRFVTAIGLIVGLIYCCFSFSVKEIRNEKAFYKKLTHEPFSIAMFYKNVKQNEAWERNLKLQRKKFKYLSHKQFYRNGHVQFLEVDMSKKHLAGLAAAQNISQVPAFVLFKGDRPVIGKDDKKALLVGFAKQEKIESFINKYLRNQIERFIEREAERKQEERALNEASATIFTLGVGYPYPVYGGGPWYGGYPYYGPGVSFGVNVGF